MNYRYTQIADYFPVPAQLSPSLPRRLGARRKPARPCSSAAALKKRWSPIFAVTIVPRHFIGSGALSAILPLRTKRERAGIGCSTRVCISSNALPGTIGFAIPQPQDNLQLKVVRDLPNANRFVAYVDAVGELDDQHCLMDWKTTTSRYPEAPTGLLTLDPQLICYSWMTGISNVALVVFVRKHQPEIQYLKTSISEEQRREFDRLVATTIGQIEAAQFPAHSGIRFPQNGCMSCAVLDSVSMTKP